jgi:hypothetical protein
LIHEVFRALALSPLPKGWLWDTIKTTLNLTLLMKMMGLFRAEENFWMTFMKNKIVLKMSIFLATLALTGCALTSERQEAIAGLLRAVSAGANAAAEIQRREQQAMSQFIQDQNQNNQQRDAAETAYQVQLMCSKPVNRKNLLCQRPK